MSMTWREKARFTIRRVIEQHPDLPRAELRAAISDAYPFGVRDRYPYRVWLKEVNRMVPKNEAQPATPDEIKYMWVRPRK